MFLAAGYFDESSDEGLEDRSYSVAGFVGSGSAALEMDIAWGELLRRFDLDYFKASEIEFGFGAFAKHRSNPKRLSDPLTDNEKDHIREIKIAFIDLICECEEMVGIGAVLLLRDYQILREESPHAAAVLPAPYVICADLALMETGLMVNEANAYYPYGTLVRPVFDSHQEHGPRFLNSFQSFQKKNPVSSRCLLPPHYEIEQDYRCLQAADCLAYEVRRLLVRDEFEPHRPMRKAIERLSDQIGRMYKLDYEALKMIAEKQAPDVIPIKRSGSARLLET